MAQRKLQPDHRDRTLMASIFTVFLMALLTLLQGCVHANDNVGMTLLFTNKSSNYIIVKRFDPDGQRGPTPGALGVGGSAQMALMAGDSKLGVPQFVELEWAESTQQAEAALDRIPKIKGEITADELKSYYRSLDNAYALRNRYIRRIDLTALLTPELLTQVRANPSTTHIKLTVVFKDDTASITAESEIWRK